MSSLRSYYTITAVISVLVAVALIQFHRQAIAPTTQAGQTLHHSSISLEHASSPADRILAQRTFRGGSRGSDSGLDGNFGGSRSQRSDYPMWQIPTDFRRDVFTFVRVVYDSGGGRGGAFGGWANDYPDCDWNFRFA